MIYNLAMDKRFDRVYILKSLPNSIERLKDLCRNFDIKDNGVLDETQDFHIAWGIGPNGLIHLSPTNFLYYDIDFFSIEEVEEYLKQFVNKSDLN